MRNEYMEETAEKSILFVLNSISVDSCHGHSLIANSPDNATRESLQFSTRNLKTSLDYPDCYSEDFHSLNRSSNDSTLSSDEQSTQVLTESYYLSDYPNTQSPVDTKVIPTLTTLMVAPLTNSSPVEADSANLKSSAVEKQNVKAFEKVHQADSSAVSHYDDNVLACERENGDDDPDSNQRTSRRGINRANNQTNRSLSVSQRYLTSQASKQSHNEKERRRRSRMKKSCEMLRDLVPGVNEKTDKASVLEIAVQYIQHLQQYLGQKQSRTEQISGKSS